MIRTLNVLALGYVDLRVHFAILGDFADADAEEMPGDAALLDAARRRIGSPTDRRGRARLDLFPRLERNRPWIPAARAPESVATSPTVVPSSISRTPCADAAPVTVIRAVPRDSDRPADRYQPSPKRAMSAA